MGQQGGMRARGRGRAKKSGRARLREPPGRSQSSHAGYTSGIPQAGAEAGSGKEEPHGDPSKSKGHSASLQEGEK